MPSTRRRPQRDVIADAFARAKIIALKAEADDRTAIAPSAENAIITALWPTSKLPMMASPMMQGTARQAIRTTIKEAMMRGTGRRIAVAAIAWGLLSGGVAGQTVPAAPTDAVTPTADNAVMITVFLKHDQSRPLSELNAQLDKQGYYKAFPPEGIEIVSWYVMMGIGQVVTLRLPASRLREVNRIFENTAWGAYRTEFYPTYDYKAIGVASHERALPK